MVTTPTELPRFQQMWDNYPTEDASIVAANIGGRVSSNVLPLVGTPQAWNTCTIRLSRSFNYAGDRIPRGHTLRRSSDRRVMATVSGADHYWYAFRVRDMDEYLQEIYGPADGALNLPHAGSGIMQNTALSGQRALLVFYFQDASGGTATSANHADLWDGARMRYNDVTLNADHSSFDIKYWEFVR